MTETLTLQAYRDGNWHGVGDLIFPEPDKGLQGPLQFYYDPGYIMATGGLDFRDERAIGHHVPGNFTGHYDETTVAPVLRDIIPQGAGRRALARLWHLDDPQLGPGLDFRLLKEGCVAPIGNLRIKEAAELFAERMERANVVEFTEKDITGRDQELLEHAHGLGVAIGGATGAGGDAPKLLMVEDHQGRYFLEGTIEDTEIAQHWLVKFPRGQMLAEDEDILRAEGIFYQALHQTGFSTISGARLVEGQTPSLWLPRFDRVIEDGQVQRYGVESVYSLKQMIGDGARLSHTEVIQCLAEACDTDFDDLLVEYLARDAVNIAIGNTDNHGRNTAILKCNGAVHLAPAYDLAPMCLDRGGIARATVWDSEFRTETGPGADYRRVINKLTHDPKTATWALQVQFEALTEISTTVHELGLPQSVAKHARVNLDHFKQWAEILAASGPGSR